MSDTSATKSTRDLLDRIDVLHRRVNEVADERAKLRSRVASLEEQEREARQMVVDLNAVAWEPHYAGPRDLLPRVETFVAERCNGMIPSWSQQ